MEPGKMKGKILACALLLIFVGCPLAQKPQVTIEDIYSIPEFDYVVAEIQAQYGMAVFVFPACGLTKDEHFYVMFTKDKEVFLATFGMVEGRWEILEINLIEKSDNIGGRKTEFYRHR